MTDMPQDMDAWARSQGYPDYETMKAFMAKRSAHLNNSNSYGAGQAPAAGLQAPIGAAAHALNYLTPSGIISWVADQYAKATGQQ